MATELYEAIVPIDHTGHRKIYQPGERFDLAHLSAAQIEILTRNGFVKLVVGLPAPEAPEAKAVKK